MKKNKNKKEPPLPPKKTATEKSQVNIQYRFSAE